MTPYGLIYKATNKVNDKVYIGLTTHTIRERMMKHLIDRHRVKYATNVFYRALRKYGTENFEWSVIDTCHDHDDMIAKEKYWIQHYNSYIHSPNSRGYNMTLGGEGVFGYKPSKETIAKILLARKGYRHSDETKLKMSLAGRGKVRTAEQRLNLSKARMGRFTGEDSSRSRAVVQLDLTGKLLAKHATVSDGAIAVDGNSTKISRCCQMAYRHVTHKDSLWLYEAEYTEENILKIVQRVQSKVKGRKRRPIIQLTAEGQMVNHYPSLKEAVEKSGIYKAKLIACCKGSLEHNGFIWKYEDEYHVRPEND